MCSSKFHKINRKTPVPESQPVNLLKNKLWHRCFSVNFAIFLRAPFRPEQLWWLLLERAVQKTIKLLYSNASDTYENCETIVFEITHQCFLRRPKLQPTCLKTFFLSRKRLFWSISIKYVLVILNFDLPFLITNFEGRLFYSTPGEFHNRIMRVISLIDSGY